MTAERYYVVWAGRKAGIYTSWEECEKQVSGFPQAKYKAFTDKKEAMDALQKGWEPYYYNKEKKKDSGLRNKQAFYEKNTYIKESISVDGASSGNPGMMEYQGVYTKTGETIFHFGPILGTNNIGEFLAIVHALAYLKKKNLDYPVYSDSHTAIKWVKLKKANTSLVKNKETEQVWNLIRRAESWLENNTYNNQILKWKTELWGENKSDFGRK